MDNLMAKKDSFKLSQPVFYQKKSFVWDIIVDNLHLRCISTWTFSIPGLYLNLHQ